MSAEAPPKPAEELATEPAPAVEIGEMGTDVMLIPAARLMLAAALAVASAAWMLGGIFEGFIPRPTAILAGVLGVAWIGFVHRTKARSAMQYLLAPIAFVAAVIAALALPNPTGVEGTIPELVLRALRSGGLLEPPVPFDPGWRFLLVVLFVLAGGAVASVPFGWQRPYLGPALVLPLIIGAGFLQPPGSELISGVVSLTAVIAALMILYTAQLAGETGVPRGFELRQAVRGGAALLVVVALLVGLNRTDFLFPRAERSLAAQPQKPKIVPLSKVKDRALFTVRSDQQGPWRLGVLDEYDGTSWLLPPFDPKRVVDIRPSGKVGSGGSDETFSATFTVSDLEGHTLPGLANPTSAEAVGSILGFDPRTQTLRARKGSVGKGYTYTVSAPVPPTGEELAAAPGSVARSLAKYTRVPGPPPTVAALLAEAPSNPWERLQFLRNSLYEKVIAAGSGVPVDVPPAKVDGMLAGGEGTPFEIVAAEALLARWSGVPARIGYGFYQGTEIAGGFEIHPRDGANWLEAYFPGRELGWVPVIGVPPRARASLAALEKNQSPVRPSDVLSLQVYIPIQIENPLLLYQVIRYWIGVAFPFVAIALLIWFFFPAPLKAWRSFRRRKWAAGKGLKQQIAVEYAEFRDLATDLNVGDPFETPLEYTERVKEDEEHLEFAWLSTRALWGDLSRDLRPADVQAAIDMGRSLRRRIARAQSPISRVLGLATRASLRTPYDQSLPNPWPRRFWREPADLKPRMAA